MDANYFLLTHIFLVCFLKMKNDTFLQVHKSLVYGLMSIYKVSTHVLSEPRIPSFLVPPPKYHPCPPQR